MLVVFVNFWLIIPTILMLIIFGFIRLVYIKAARCMKRIESMSKWKSKNTFGAKEEFNIPRVFETKKTGRSPIYNHANATLQGLTTIRAFKAQDVLCSEFNAFQNFNSSAWYLYYSLANSFAFTLEMVCLCYLAAVLFSFLIYSDAGTRNLSINFRLICRR